MLLCHVLVSLATGLGSHSAVYVLGAWCYVVPLFDAWESFVT